MSRAALVFFLLPALMLVLPSCGGLSASEKHYEAGVELFDQGRFEDAVAEFDEAIRLDPGHAEAFSSRGLAQGSLGNLSRAVQDYTEAIRLDAQSVVAYNNRGIAFRALGQSRRAIEDFETAIQLNSHFAVGYLNRGDTHIALGNIPSAFEDYSEAIRLDSQFGLAYAGRAIAQTILGRDEEATKDFDRALELGHDPDALEVATQHRPSLGLSDAPVTIVEFTDYQCPFCGRHFRDTMPRLLSDHPGRIRYFVLNYPLREIHPFSQKAAEAAECAYDQGQFWAYRDLLFQNQQALSVDNLKNHARDLGLNAEVFEACLDTDANIGRVSRDIRHGQAHGVNGTPTFFINGQRLVGAQPLGVFDALINMALGR